MDQYQFVSLVIAVFVAGASLALFFSRAMAGQSKDFNGKIDAQTTSFNSKIDAQTVSFNTKIDNTSTKLEHKIEGLDIVAKSDRVSITSKIETLDERDRSDHKEMIEQITQLRIAVGDVETKKERTARTRRRK
jgi:hypothetical protein